MNYELKNQFLGSALWDLIEAGIGLADTAVESSSAENIASIQASSAKNLTNAQLQAQAGQLVLDASALGLEAEKEKGKRQLILTGIIGGGVLLTVALLVLSK